MDVVSVAALIIASLALAANGVLAWLTWRLAGSSAALVLEAQRDRELAVQPFLLFEAGPMAAITGQDYGVGFRNIGSGPAIGCVYEAVSGVQGTAHEAALLTASILHFHRLGTYALEPGGRIDPELHMATPGPAPRDRRNTYAFLLDRPDYAGNFRLEVLRCLDLFGNHFLFVRGEVRPTIFYADRRSTDWWKHGDPELEWTKS